MTRAVASWAQTHHAYVVESKVVIYEIHKLLREFHQSLLVPDFVCIVFSDILLRTMISNISNFLRTYYFLFLGNPWKPLNYWFSSYLFPSLLGCNVNMEITPKLFHFLSGIKLIGIRRILKWFFD